MSLLFWVETEVCTLVCVEMDSTRTTTISSLGTLEDDNIKED